MADEPARLLALLSHELRGPLGVVRGVLRLITQTEAGLSAQSRQALAASLRASERLADLLDEASLFAHLRIGDVTLDRKPVPLSTIVHASIQAAVLPEGSSVDLDAAALPSVMLEADEARLRMALATFMTAVARTQTSNVVVEVRAAPARLANQSAVRLRIAPRTMSGVDAKEAELNSGRGGFGLAIPIAAAIIDGHGGRVRELRHGERSAGLLVTLPVSGSGHES